MKENDWQVGRGFRLPIDGPALDIVVEKGLQVYRTVVEEVKIISYWYFLLLKIRVLPVQLHRRLPGPDMVNAENCTVLDPESDLTLIANTNKKKIMLAVGKMFCVRPSSFRIHVQEFGQQFDRGFRTDVEGFHQGYRERGQELQ